MVLFFFCAFLTCCAFSKIVYVQGLTRHCDRVPSANVQFPFNPIDWKEKLGLDYYTLTNLGSNQCYQMGERIRERYIQEGSKYRIDGISENYNPDDYQFMASSKDRTHRSIYSAGFGIFPKTVGPVYPSQRSDDLKNRNDDVVEYALPNGTTPIPVIVPSYQNDILLRAYDLCNLTSQKFSKYYESEFTKEYFKEYEDRFTEFSLEKFGKSFPLKSFINVYTYMKFLENHNFNYNITMNIKDWEFMEEIENKCEWAYQNTVIGPEAVSPYVEDILDNIKTVMNEKKNNPKFRLFGGHDSTIAAFLFSTKLSVFHEQLMNFPKYGSGIFVELHKDEISGNYSVVFVYHPKYNSNDWEEYGIESLEHVPVEEFINFMKNNVTVPSWCSVCQSDKYNVVVGNCVRRLLNNNHIYNISSEILMFCMIAIGFLESIILISCFVFQIMSRINLKKGENKNYEGGIIIKNV